ncbi:hypothetical protein SAMN04489727_4131 [Amycolatopsis tolypomycina]|uniref:Uncharacterized protein n=1 Tax=Amycolatopsis tolypomycina TaxID=208445 RepID=A0A1H4TDA9_9PSEU|nr:hypothetical protein SAMN04489727_4131 [Amycolatopsis tolypomycina]
MNDCCREVRSATIRQKTLPVATVRSGRHLHPCGSPARVLMPLSGNTSAAPAAVGREPRATAGRPLAVSR